MVRRRIHCSKVHCAKHAVWVTKFKTVGYTVLTVPAPIPSGPGSSRRYDPARRDRRGGRDGRGRRGASPGTAASRTTMAVVARPPPTADGGARRRRRRSVRWGTRRPSSGRGRASEFQNSGTNHGHDSVSLGQFCR
jgi:hypothetical protein